MHQTSSDLPPAPADRKYDLAPDPAFASGIMSFDWEDWLEGSTKVGRVAPGDCPHCGDAIALWRQFVRGVDSSSTYTADCNCLEWHEGRPATVRQGCGQRAIVDLEGWDPEFGSQK